MTDDWPPAGRPFIRTRAGHEGFANHVFMGFQVGGAHLTPLSGVGRVMLAITGRVPTQIDVELANCISDAFSLSDPRVPPLLLARLAASYGRPLAGVASTLLGFSDGTFGPPEAAAACHVLERLAGERDASTESDPVTQWIQTAFSGGRPPPGFGIPLKRTDNGGAYLATLVEQIGHRGRHWAVYLRLRELSLQPGRAPANMNLALAALCLDLGFDALGTETFLSYVGVQNMLANAVEAARQQATIYKQLPTEFVDYQGPQPRVSPRAEDERD